LHLYLPCKLFWVTVYISLNTREQLLFIYIVWDIVSHLKMIAGTQKAVPRFCANTMPFYIRDLCFCRFWCWNQCPVNTKGWLYVCPHMFTCVSTIWALNRRIKRWKERPWGLDGVPYWPALTNPAVETSLQPNFTLNF
jgi:hypothetical protein